MGEENGDSYTPTARSKVKRSPYRGKYDHETVHSILDAGYLCHVGYSIEGQPYVTPTTYWREGEWLYWHGSAASRFLKTVGQGLPVCLTVSHADGLVLGRSAMHHSMNYRSVMAFGTAKAFTDHDEKLKLLETYMESIMPGRWADMRAPWEKEIKVTTIVGMEIEEASAKIRTGKPLDEESDYDDATCWAGVLPLETAWGAPEPCPRLPESTAFPDYLRGVKKP